MEFEIKEESGVFNVTGTICASNLTSLKNHFESVIYKADKVILNIEKVRKIDSSGALMLEKLYKKTALSNKVLSIIGKQNPSIVSMMKSTKTHYILSNDRI